ncbi:MAG: glycosyltransferase family 4 protein [Anaerolineales bacterium]|nr:glycosyltransferase family 4 protein [Anaerolineales bacterium]
MRVVLNGWFLAHDAHTGTGQYTRALLNWLPQVAPQNDYVVVIPDRRDREGFENLHGLNIHSVPCGSSNLAKVRFEQQLFPAACRELKADVAHVPYWAPPLSSPAPVIVTIHDVIPLVLPEYRGDWRVRLYTSLVSVAARGVTGVLADSAQSKQDILKHLGVPEEKVRVVPLAADARFTPQNDWRADEAVRAKYNVPVEAGSYVLYLGGFDVRKNVRALLSAWTWAAGPVGESYPLVLAGALPKPDGALFEDYAALAEQLEISSTVRFVGPIAEEDKAALYRGAALFAYPSRYEGFGLPPLEAMACGVPVITTDAGSINEVVGDAAYLIDPQDTRKFGAGLITCLVEPSVSDHLRARGLERAKKFSWERTARETVAAYEVAVPK